MTKGMDPFGGGLDHGLRSNDTLLDIQARVQANDPSIGSGDGLLDPKNVDKKSLDNIASKQEFKELVANFKNLANVLANGTKDGIPDTQMRNFELQFRDLHAAIKEIKGQQIGRLSDPKLDTKELGKLTQSLEFLRSTLEARNVGKALQAIEEVAAREQALIQKKEDEFKASRNGQSPYGQGSFQNFAKGAAAPPGSGPNSGNINIPNNLPPQAGMGNGWGASRPPTPPPPPGPANRYNGAYNPAGFNPAQFGVGGFPTNPMNGVVGSTAGSPWVNNPLGNNPWARGAANVANMAGFAAYGGLFGANTMPQGFLRTPSARNVNNGYTPGPTPPPGPNPAQGWGQGTPTPPPPGPFGGQGKAHGNVNGFPNPNNAGFGGWGGFPGQGNVGGTPPGGTPPPPGGGSGGSGGPGGSGGSGGAGSGNNNLNGLLSSFIQEAKAANAKYNEFKGKQAGYVSSTLTRGDIKQIQESLKASLTAIWNSPTASQDTKDQALAEFQRSMAKFDSAYKEQNNIVKGIGAVVSTLASLQIGSIASQVLISEPLQYRTMPALGAAGQTGEVGNAMSGALSSVESWRAEKNQGAVMTGGAIAGLSMMLPGALKIGGMIAGGGVAATGLTQHADDIVDSTLGNLGGVSSNEIKRNQLAKTMTDPKRLIKRNALFNDVYTAMGSRLPDGVSGSNMSATGVFTGVGVTKETTGNYFVDQLYKKRVGGMNMASIGLDVETSAQRLAQMGSSLNNKTQNEKEILTSKASIWGKGLGVDYNNIASQFTAAQSVGINDVSKNYANSLGVFANANGEVSTFAANVLQPALAKVAQGLSMRNVAANSEKLSESVYAFQKTMMTDFGETKIGRRMSQSPEIMEQMAGNFGNSVENMMKSTQGIYSMVNIGGLNPMDAILGKTDPKIMAQYLDGFGKVYGVNESMMTRGAAADGSDDKLNSSALGVVQTLSKQTGISLADAAAQIELIIESLSKGDLADRMAANAKDLDANGNKAIGAANKSAAEQAKGPLPEAERKWAEQSDLYGKTTQSIAQGIIELQQKAIDYAKDESFNRDIKAGLGQLKAQLGNLLNVKRESGGSTSDTPPPPTTLDPKSPIVGDRKSLVALNNLLPDVLARDGKGNLKNSGTVSSVMAELKNDSSGLLAQNPALRDLFNNKSLPDADKLAKLQVHLQTQLGNITPEEAKAAGKGLPAPNKSPIAKPKPPTSTKLPAPKMGLPDSLVEIGMTTGNLNQSQQTFAQELANPAGTKGGSNWKDIANGKVANEDAVLDNIIRKTQAKLNDKKTPESKRAGLSAGLSALQGIKTMTQGQAKSAATAYAVMGAAKNSGALSSETQYKLPNGKTTDFMGNVITKPTTQGSTQKAPPTAKPPAPASGRRVGGNGLPTPEASLRSSGDTVVIEIRGDGQSITSAVKNAQYGSGQQQTRKIV